MSLSRIFALLPLAVLLSGCKFVVLSPSGDVAGQQRDLVVIATLLMLLVIVPVMALTVLFAWRYRQSNCAARYEPDWDHSTQLELVIWAAPLLIIIGLGAVTWMGTHLLDPYRPLDRLGAGRLASGRPASDRPLAGAVKPLEVQVVALDWKWLFLYPEDGIATVNELAAPVDRPIHFRITASSVMNSFYIPALAGQIYAMPGMETRLHAVINAPGAYQGFSANYSGAGFSGMRFTFHGLADADYRAWVDAAKAGGGTLDRAGYLQLERPSENVPVRRYAAADPGLYRAILNLCVEPGKMCMDEMAAIDARGGLGMAGIATLMPLSYDKYARRGAVFGPPPSQVAGICSIAEATALADDATAPAKPAGGTPFAGAPLGGAPLIGAGLPRPAPFAGLRPASNS